MGLSKRREKETGPTDGSQKDRKVLLGFLSLSLSFFFFSSQSFNAENGRRKESSVLATLLCRTFRYFETSRDDAERRTFSVIGLKGLKWIRVNILAW